MEIITTTVSGSSPTTRTLKSDDAGNLAFDGTYAYQYDAWNRVVESEAAHLSGSDIVSDALLKHLTYDALGRLATTTAARSAAWPGGPWRRRQPPNTGPPDFGVGPSRPGGGPCSDSRGSASRRPTTAPNRSRSEY